MPPPPRSCNPQQRVQQSMPALQHTTSCTIPYHPYHTIHTIPYHNIITSYTSGFTNTRMWNRRHKSCMPHPVCPACMATTCYFFIYAFPATARMQNEHAASLHARHATSGMSWQARHIRHATSGRHGGIAAQAVQPRGGLAFHTIQPQTVGKGYYNLMGESLTWHLSKHKR